MIFSSYERKTLEEMQLELEDQRELAGNRMNELESLETNYKECLKDVDRLKMDLSTLPEYVVVETTEHKCLQSQFSVLYNEVNLSSVPNRYLVQYLIEILINIDYLRHAAQDNAGGDERAASDVPRTLT